MHNYCIKYCLAIACFVLSAVNLFAQIKIKGVVADSASLRPLPFATIQNQHSGEVVIAGISGQFSMIVPGKSGRLIISNVGYSSRQAEIRNLDQNDTIFLTPLIKSLAEVIIRPDKEKIKRIINTCIRNKPLHNPDHYETYQCSIYYKMKTDLLPDAATRASLDTSRPKNGRGLDYFLDSSHLLFSEVFSQRTYKRPAHLNEVVIASRFSGLKKTYFSSLVTDVLPFHVYDDYILLGGKEYASPIARGWEQRYQFRLVDEIKAGNDTIFILSFSPKSKSKFNGLEGVVYIHSHEFAISHFIGSSTDAKGERIVKIEQLYTIENGRWFPKELNYDLVFYKYPFPGLGFSINGHSVISGVSYPPGELLKIDKTYSVRLGDSVDLYTNGDWERFRTDSISAREITTYHIMDSIFQKVKAEKIIAAAGKLVIGRLPLGKFELDITRLMARNKYEGTRVGFGVYTGDKISSLFSTGGWLGYGTKDQVMKYGLSGTFFPRGNRDNWVEIRYQKEYQSPGNYRIHPDLDRTGFRNWILSLADEVKGISLNLHLHKGYWQLDFTGAKQEIFTRYDNGFRYRGLSLRSFDHLEAGAGLRFAFGEKRIPAFGFYLPTPTQFPIIYCKLVTGRIRSGEYRADYIRAHAAISFRKHMNRWGNDNFRLEAGIIKSFDRQALSRSFLLAGNGFRSEGLHYFAWGGFLTMRPYDFYNDRYLSLLYKHDLDWYVWESRYSKPFLSLGHNFLYGNLDLVNKTANENITSTEEGFHETGLMMNQLLQVKLFHAFYLYMNAGGYYHWNGVFDWSKNGVWVLGFSAGI